FTDAPIERPFIRTVKIEKLTRDSYQEFRLRPVSELLEAAHVLFVEWDGYVVASRAWRQHFLDYDYIGAKWGYSDGMNVGNSGFSLLSRKLLKALAEQQLPFDGKRAVDLLICRKYRPALERQYGIRFAPENVAVEFSYEHEAPPAPTFGFHGMGSMWRYVEDLEMIKLFDSVHPHVFETAHSLFLLHNYHRVGRLEQMHRLYAKIRSTLAGDIVLNRLIDLLSPGPARDLFGACERYWLATHSLEADVMRSRITRNEPCPCGSGQKYKHCHGRY